MCASNERSCAARPSSPGAEEVEPGLADGAHARAGGECVDLRDASSSSPAASSAGPRSDGWRRPPARAARGDASRPTTATSRGQCRPARRRARRPRRRGRGARGSRAAPTPSLDLEVGVVVVHRHDERFGQRRVLEVAGLRPRFPVPSAIGRAPASPSSVAPPRSRPHAVRPLSSMRGNSASTRTCVPTGSCPSPPATPSAEPSASPSPPARRAHPRASRSPSAAPATAAPRARAVPRTAVYEHRPEALALRRRPSRAPTAPAS